MGMYWNATITGLAADIAAQLGAGVNGLHLRLEGDARGWNRHMRREGEVQQHVEAMREAGFDACTPVDMASGLLYPQPAAGGCG